ncbi:Uncharacterised protein [Streptococcus pneumoniae]|nr:Uncharacterised protein [Streptococcus pneumoniae]CJA50777.1 Uncharacterised protein [Streptococcus pneumoniae]CJA74185.1 Uncharacterised protein [Streptococcus pneumoniae]CJB77297.1 Uncharacterised protein [Streptococcus pneumoniae]CJB82374.1 Uncharacterised protein [Streptococcus pneumoniae]
MKKELIQVVESYIDWIHIQFEDSSNFIGDDYIDSIEDMFQESGILYNQDDLKQTMQEIVHALSKEYGANNVFYGAPEHTILIGNRYVTIYNQLIVLINH